MILSDDTPSSATTGDVLVFNVDTRDAWGIDAVTVDYWTDDAPTPVSLSLSLTAGTVNEGRWRADVTMASGSTSPFHYNVTLRDVNKLESKAATRTVSVTDNDPPVLGLDTSPDAGTTGEPFDFNISVIDNIGIAEVHAEYWFGTGTHTNITLAGTDPYLAQITVPSGSTDSLNYFLSAVDAAGGWAWLPAVTIPITDNDPPVISVATVPEWGMTGDPLEVQPTISDNIGIVNAYVEYWFGTGGHFNDTLSSTDGYAVSINIQSASLDELHLFLSAVDAAGLWYWTDTKLVPVMDNDPPTFGTDSSDTETNPGGTLTFTVVASDNIGVTSVKVDYWFGTGTHTEMSMAGTGTYSYEFTVPVDMVEPLSYQFKAVDAAGNEMTTTAKTITVKDDVDPTLGADGSDAAVVNGGEFTFKVTASDNIGVVEVLVKYKWGTEAYQEQAMTEDGAYEFKITVPSSETRALTYMFVATDGAGNSVSSQEYTRMPVDRTVPTFADDASDATVNAGKSFNFTATWQDNVNVVEAYVEYWYDGQQTNNISMTRDGSDFKYTMTVPDTATGLLHYRFKAKDAGGNWAQTNDHQLDIVEKVVEEPEEEEGGISMTLLAAVILIIVLVVVLWLIMSRRKGPAAEPASEPRLEAATPPSGPTGGTATVMAPVAAPPAAGAVPVGAAMAKGGAGKFTILNTRVPCAGCGAIMERNTNAYVCSCGSAIHEQCAGRLKVCPTCKANIRLN